MKRVGIRHQEAQQILREIRKRRFSFSLHAEARGFRRALSTHQVIEVAKNVVYWTWQADHETYLFVGRLADSKGAGFSAVVENGVVIVTVFRRKLKHWERNNGDAEKL